MRRKEKKWHVVNKLKTVWFVPYTVVVSFSSTAAVASVVVWPPGVEPSVDATDDVSASVVGASVETVIGVVEVGISVVGDVVVGVGVVVGSGVGVLAGGATVTISASTDTGKKGTDE